jgi:hypothetical protein
MYNFQLIMVWVVWGVATFWLCNVCYFRHLLHFPSSLFVWFIYLFLIFDKCDKRAFSHFQVYDSFGIVTGMYHGVLRYQRLGPVRMAAHIFGRLFALFVIFVLPYCLGFSLAKSLLMGTSFTLIFRYALAFLFV